MSTDLAGQKREGTLIAIGVLYGLVTLGWGAFPLGVGHGGSSLFVLIPGSPFSLLPGELGPILSILALGIWPMAGWLIARRKRTLALLGLLVLHYAGVVVLAMRWWDETLGGGTGCFLGGPYLFGQFSLWLYLLVRPAENTDVQHQAEPTAKI